MKKVLSLVLVLSMVLGCFAFVSASDYSDVKNSEVYSEAVNVLSGLGVVNGYPDGTFKPEKVVTRAEMATMLVNCLGIPVSGSASTPFSDVPSTHWASGYINYAASVGFIAGYPSGVFKPEQQVTHNEALTMIVASLGYSADSLPGTWPGSFVNKAKGLGILETCKTTGSDGAPRADISCYLYDALGQQIGITTKDGEFVSNYQQSGYNKEDTMMTRLGATMYDGGNGAGEPFIVTEADIENSQINIADHLGEYVTAYQNKDEEIIALKKILSEFIEGELADLQDDYKNVDVAHEVAGYMSFTNGAKDSPKKDITVPTGTIKLAVKLSGKSVSEIYSMQVWDGEKPFRAAKDIQDEIIDDKAIGGFDFALDDNDEIDMTSFSLAGRDSVKDIAKDDIVTVYLKAGKIARIEVGTERVEGEVDRISKDNEYTVAGKTFKANADIAPALLTSVKPGTEGIFFLTYGGEWFDFEESDESTSNYAVLLATGKETSKYGDVEYFVNMFMPDGKAKEFKAKDAAALTGFTVPDDNIGVLVEYTINSSDEITGFTKATVSGNKTFDKNGICGKIALKDNTVVFQFSGIGTELGKADKYDVVKSADMYDTTCTTMTEIVSDGQFKAILTDGASGTTKNYALFIDHEATTADGEVWSALYEGAVKELTLDGPTPAKLNVVTTPAAVNFYTLTIASDGVVTSVTPAAAADEKDADVSGATSYSNHVFTDGANKNYSLDDDIKVYIYDVSEKEWTAKGASALEGRKNAFTSITLYKTSSTGDYDIAIVVKP